MKLHLADNPDSLILERRNSFLSFCAAFNHLPVDQLTVENLANWFTDLRTKQGYGNKNLNCIRINMNAFFKWLVGNEHLPKNPLESIRFRLTQTRDRPRTIMAADEIADMLGKLKALNPIIYPFIYTLVHTGARKNEIRLLKWTQVDFGTGYIHLRKCKNGEDRSVRMSATLTAFLATLPRAGDFVFVNQRGFQISIWQIDDALIALQKEHPHMKKFRCHDLRHSFAFNFLRTGGQMYQLQAILGHKNIGMTVDFYGNFKAQDVERVSPYGF